MITVTTSIYNVVGINNFNSVMYDCCFMERELADRVYEKLQSCVDCGECAIIDATTGEVLANCYKYDC